MGGAMRWNDKLVLRVWVGLSATREDEVLIHLLSGLSYAVHPLDLTTTTPNGDDVICTNAYQCVFNLSVPDSR